ncbi:MAG: high-potential iron-sulfur protein [Bacteriovorax sp.]|nr:high-potential iron-sulfur protein [Rhizobacter sp.]
MTTNRRIFMMTVAATGAALTAKLAMAQAKLDEKDAQAVALGYVADTTKADAKKYPKHEATQMCSNCALYQGKAGDAAGNCPLFAGKQVDAKGWCSAWAKKA